MDAIPSNLCTLVEQLEDAREFHDGAARQSDGLSRERHSARSLAYAMMLSEIRDWESRKREAGLRQGPGTPGLDPDLPYHDDSYAALLERVYRIHSSLVPVGRAIRVRATTIAMDRGGAGSGVRIGERMHC
jgi:hypothetical protein